MLSRRRASQAPERSVADCQLKLKTVPFDQVPLADIVRKRADEVGLLGCHG
jgi:3-hydroxyacyl-[acyl-carrier-protein] dehydratase